MKNYVTENLAAMKKDLAELVAFNSVNADDGEPFGKANQEVLATALRQMQDKGFRVRNLDNYCGYGEVGEGEKVIGILAHLDIVPAGDGWDSDPFTLIEKDGYLYGRGVSDDKGAAVAAIYALNYLKEINYPFRKRVRVILGCNEETGSACIRHYVEKEGHIDYGFTPDAGFPGIYAEKGIIGGVIRGKSEKILSIYGGDASNIVPKKVIPEIKKATFNQDKLENYFKDNNISYKLSVGDTVQLTVEGVAAHSSTPDLGINAIQYLFAGLYVADFDDELTAYLHKYFALEKHGETLGFEALKDDASDTSINLGVIKTEDGVISISLDMRFPVKSSVEKCQKLLEVLNDGNISFQCGGRAPLYFDVNSPMIKALKKAYEEVSGDYTTPMEAIGGGTYAKAINNCIAFGCEFPGENNHIHDANERLNCEKFKDQVAIYIQAIKNLNEVE